MTSVYTQPNFLAQTASQYKTAIDDSTAVMSRLSAVFGCHAQSTPDMTVRVDAGVVPAIGGAHTEVAAQDSATLVTPSVNPRNDIVYIDQTTGTMGVATGAENASPVDPSVPAGKIAIARINWIWGMSQITNSDIDDLRAGVQWLGLGDAAFEDVASGGTGDLLRADGDGSGLSGVVSSNVPLRQTVLGGPVTSAGLPDFLPATDADLNLASQNIDADAPFVVVAANGFGTNGANDRIGQSTSNLTWSNLTASDTCYLYIDVAADGTLTTGHTILAPTYQKGGTYSIVSDQATFNINEMVMKIGDGAAANQVWRVFVGEAVTDVTSVTSTIAYAYCGRYESAFASFSAGGNYVEDSNIGVTDVVIDHQLKCVTADIGYSVGYIALNPGYDITSNYGATPAILSKTQSRISWGSGGPLLINASTYVTSSVTVSSWHQNVIVTRNW